MSADRPVRQQHVLSVESTTALGPHMVRVTLTGESLAELGDTRHTDSYVKLLFVDPALGLTPPYDMAALKDSLPKAQRPVRRTYTVRRVDREARRMEIDFVTHAGAATGRSDGFPGPAGVAGPWAQAARPGDLLAMVGPGGGYHPRRKARWHLFAGDLSAVPAIAASLEALPEDARGVAHLEVAEAGDVLPLTVPAGVEVRWLVNPDPTDAGFLARAVDGGPWPGKTHKRKHIQVFAHGERESIKAVRRVLRDRDIPKDAISISGYWARGRTEDAFQQEKREPIGRIG